MHHNHDNDIVMQNQKQDVAADINYNNSESRLQFTRSKFCSMDVMLFYSQRQSSAYFLMVAKRDLLQ